MSGTQPCTSGVFAGMTTAQLQAALTTAQTALINLVAGGQPQVVMYSQGEGTRSVTYTRTNEAQLRNLIRELSQALGLGHGRRAIGVRFGVRRHAGFPSSIDGNT